MRDYWYGFRWWLASKIVGVDLHEEIEDSYQAGVQYAQARNFLGMP
jgi:hypothetical protein